MVAQFCLRSSSVVYISAAWVLLIGGRRYFFVFSDVFKSTLFLLLFSFLTLIVV